MALEQAKRAKACLGERHTREVEPDTGSEEGARTWWNCARKGPRRGPKGLLNTDPWGRNDTQATAGGRVRANTVKTSRGERATDIALFKLSGESLR